MLHTLKTSKLSSPWPVTLTTDRALATLANYPAPKATKSAATQ